MKWKQFEGLKEANYPKAKRDDFCHLDLRIWQKPPPWFSHNNHGRMAPRTLQHDQKYTIGLLGF
ncbi:hypothetical protein BPOR_0318g00070 [Botrytis porri]|uniref:Uncharacterized protein n=1 Tax=Botrytis porri TaxID=87229 RepID=A0A4Z1KJL4_9HELO|nr:hypothetical protein BPOR_0318g00070 [Botrytis porri]